MEIKKKQHLTNYIKQHAIWRIDSGEVNGRTVTGQ